MSASARRTPASPLVSTVLSVSFLLAIDVLSGPLGRKLGEIWKSMGETERKPYEDKAVADKKRYEEQKANYLVCSPSSLCSFPPLITIQAGDDEEESS